MTIKVTPTKNGDWDIKIEHKSMIHSLLIPKDLLHDFTIAIIRADAKRYQEEIKKIDKLLEKSHKVIG